MQAFPQMMIALTCCALGVAASDVCAEEVRILHNGITLNADTVLTDGKTVADNMIMIVHGTLGHKDMEIIETLQSVLQESGRSSLAINLSLDIDDRHGFYPCELRHTHRFDDAVAEIDAWRDWLSAQGANDIVLLGHSRGANQAVKYALSGRPSFSRLVLLAPPTTHPAVENEKLGRLAAMNSSDWLPKQRFLHCENAQVQVGTYLSYQGATAGNDTVPQFSALRLSTLVISGSDDSVVPDLSGRMADIGNKLVSHVDIEGADHFFRDLYAYDVVDAIDVFLARQTPPPRLINWATSLQDDVHALAGPQEFHVIFISQAGCQYCELLRKTVLRPMIRGGGLDERIVLREVSLDGDFELRDFEGRAVTGLNFAERYGAYVTPTMLFLDANGENLVKPLVGTGNIEFYGYYLEKKINEAANDRQ
jgi:thioredoxin-related protein